MALVLTGNGAHEHDAAGRPLWDQVENVPLLGTGLAVGARKGEVAAAHWRMLVCRCSAQRSGNKLLLFRGGAD